MGQYQTPDTPPPPTHTAELLAMADGDTTGCRAECVAWKIRSYVAMRAGYYLTIHIREDDLREAELDQVVAAWADHVRKVGASADFEEFFCTYCIAVEGDASEQLVAHFGHEAEYRRVWTAHARSASTPSAKRRAGTPRGRRQAREQTRSDMLA